MAEPNLDLLLKLVQDLVGDVRQIREEMTEFRGDVGRRFDEVNDRLAVLDLGMREIRTNVCAIHERVPSLESR